MRFARRADGRLTISSYAISHAYSVIGRSFVHVINHSAGHVFQRRPHVSFDTSKGVGNENIADTNTTTTPKHRRRQTGQTVYFLRAARLRLEALAVDNARAGLVVLLLRAPHVLERAERRQDGTTDPDGVLALRRCDDLDTDGARAEARKLLLHALRDTGVHGGTTGQDDVAVQITTDIEVALEDRVVRRLVNTGRFETKERRLEERLGCAEAEKQSQHTYAYQSLCTHTARCQS